MGNLKQKEHLQCNRLLIANDVAGVRNPTGNLWREVVSSCRYDFYLNVPLSFDYSQHESLKQGGEKRRNRIIRATVPLRPQSKEIFSSTLFAWLKSTQSKRSLTLNPTKRKRRVLTLLRKREGALTLLREKKSLKPT